MREKERKNIIAAVVALLLLALLVPGVIYYIRLQNDNREKNLKITPTFTGRPEQANK